MPKLEFVCELKVNSLVLDDFGKLKHCLQLMTPKLIFARDGKVYEKALSLSQKMFQEAKIVTVENDFMINFSELINTKSTDEVNEAFDKVKPENVAKVLFTSG
jgi:feruloyl-CoA synthase